MFRYFTGVSVVYFALLWLYALFATGWAQSIQIQLWGNLMVYIGLFGYLNLTFLEKRLRSLYLPLGLITATIFPIVGNFAYLLGPTQDNIYAIINRSWLWLPTLFVPLVLIAWQYSYNIVLIYTIFTNGLELIVLLVLMDKITYENISLVSVPFIRAFAFGIVGFIVNTLMKTLRQQNQKLIQSNLRLNQYISTSEQLATNRERNRLAVELHDTLAHTLSGLSINLEAIKTVVVPGNHEAQMMLDNSLKITRSGLDETRRVLKALRAGPLEDLGLKMALTELVEAAAARCSLLIELHCPDQLPVLPMEVEQSIYRIVQEGLENIVRHANATEAVVKIVMVSERLELSIHDNGTGFDAHSGLSDGKFGLLGLQDRAQAIGGVLIVDSEQGDGTTIRFIWERLND